MKKYNVIEFILVGILVCAGLSCKSASSENTAADGNASLTDSANSNTIAVEKPLPTPVADCPTETFLPGDSVSKQVEKYEGCTVTMSGKLIELNYNSVVLVSSYESNSTLSDASIYSPKALYCGGYFGDTTYSQIADKLDSLKQNGQFDKLPTVAAKGTVRTTRLPYSDEFATGVRECVITDFQK